jgi:hypothetical protein
MNGKEFLTHLINKTHTHARTHKQREITLKYIRVSINTSANHFLAIYVL